jgi:hypothetical protein
MFNGETDAAQKAESAAEWFGNAEEFLSHGRPVRRETAREHGIVINDLEDDGELQDAVLSVHHTALISMTMVPIAKLIENHRERAWMQTIGQLQLPLMQLLGAPGPAPIPPMPTPPVPGSPPSLPTPPAL